MLQSTNGGKKEDAHLRIEYWHESNHKQMMMGTLHNQSKLVSLHFYHISEIHYILFCFETYYYYLTLR